MEIQKNQNIGKLVAKDYRLAAIFKKYGIDFCCQGNRSISDACIEKKMDVDNIINDLNNIVANINNAASIDYQSWPLDLLADYIEKTHHRDVEEKDRKSVV